MKSLFCHLIALIVLLILVACGRNPKNDEGGLELSEEQLKELMKRQMPKPGGGQAGSDIALLQLEENYITDSSNIDNVYNLAYLYCSRCLADSSYSDCPKALQYLNRVTVLQHDYRRRNAFYNRGLCHQHMGNYSQALADIEVFAELHLKEDKPPVNFYLQKAIILHQWGKKEEACLELKNAAKVDSSAVSALDWGGNCR